MADDQKPGVVIGIPSRGTVQIQWALCVQAMLAPLGYTVATKVVLKEKVEVAREAIMDLAIDADAKYLFWLDDDVLVPQQAFRRLIYLMDTHPEWDLLSGVYMTKETQTSTPLIFTDKPGGSWDWKFNTQFPITGCGLGCCVVRVESAAQIPSPRFEWVSEAGSKGRREEGEDMNFCRKLLEAGGTLICDGGILCGHMNADGKTFQMPPDAPPLQDLPDGALEDFYLVDPDLAEVSA